MPSYKYLLKLIREGKTPAQIMELMPMRPGRWRRMLNRKRFREELAIAESLAAVMAVHRVATGVQSAAERFSELMECDKPETARKVAIALLREGLHHEETPGEGDDDQDWDDDKETD